MHTRKSVAEPTQSKNTPPPTPPPVFEWYENRIEEGLSKLYRVDVCQRQKIVEIIREFEDSTMFWSLIAKWDDAYAAEKVDEAKHQVLMALLARVYIAGTLRECQAVDL